MIVVALGLLAASSGPFNRAYAKQSGAQLTASYDRTKVTDAQLTEAARNAAASAGPFAQVALEGAQDSLVTVGRADPGGAVDRLNVWKGRWANAVGEIVLNRNPTSSDGRGAPQLNGTMSLGGRTFTVVGFAYSVSHSAGAWVTPEQMSALKPTSTQMLYRFAHAATNEELTAGQQAVTAGLPSGALLGTQS